MDFGVTFPSRVGDFELVELAERLGYRQAWFYDSQMIYSDVYATMALAAFKTSKIRLGTGVAVPTTRMAPEARQNAQRRSLKMLFPDCRSLTRRIHHNAAHYESGCAVHYEFLARPGGMGQ